MGSMQQWGGLAAFALVGLFLFLVVIGPDLVYPAMGLPRPSRTPPDLATRLATSKSPSNTSPRYKPSLEVNASPLQVADPSRPSVTEYTGQVP